MESLARVARKQGLANLLLGILVLGSLWGLSEVAVSGGLRAAAFPYRSGLLTGKMNGSIYARMGAGASAALVASVGFYFIGTHVAPCNYLLSFATPGSFVVKEGLVWAAFSAVLLPLGYSAGQRLAAGFAPSLTRRSLYYATIGAVVFLCWGASALAISAGL